MKDVRRDMENHWDNRAKNIRKWKGEVFYTVTGIPFYGYRRNLTLEVLNKFDVNGKRILEVGCGDGYYCRYLKKGGADVIGVDISDEMIKLAKRNAEKNYLTIPFYKIDGQHLDFEDNSFGIVLIVTVLQHILDVGVLNTLLSEIRRVTPGGLMIFESTRPKADIGPMWVVRTPDEYVALFKKHNFVLESHFVISSPFYRLMIEVLPSSLTKRSPMLSRVELIYSKLLVAITKQLDKIWQDRNGLGYFWFKNEK